jgi:hypothetical protein
VKPFIKLRNRISTAVLLAAMTFAPAPAHAQGCSQCKDNAASTPPATQRAYRHAILLLTAAGGGLFVATVCLLRRNR